jgi:hypothetical protein
MTTIRLCNASPFPFTGWLRTKTDRPPQTQAGMRDNMRFQVGRATGLDTVAIDLYCALQPGEQRVVDLDGFDDTAPFSVPIFDVLGTFGGWPAINDQPMDTIAHAVDGASWTLTLRSRVGHFVVDLWLRHYVGNCYVTGEAMVTCSDPTSPAVQFTTHDLRLTFGKGTILRAPHTSGGDLLVSAGESWADGQARVIPLTILWLGMAHGNISKLLPALAMNTLHVRALGVERLSPTGNPRLPAGFDPVAWTRERLTPSILRMNTWDPMVIGVNCNSGDTGAQEEQLISRGECFHERGLGAELVYLLNAWKLGARPCHHRNFDGTVVDPEGHPNLRIWTGRPHHTCADQLGKTTGLQPEQAHGWFGSDPEHKMFATLWAACRLVDSPAAQRLLEHQAQLCRLEATTGPGSSGTWFFASRAVGYESLFAVACWFNLEDRDLAEKVKAHWLLRVERVFIPQLETHAYQIPDVWDARLDDPRLGPGWRWLPWQQALGAYGLDVAGKVLVSEAARELALRAAKAVLRDAYVLRSGAGTDQPRWITRDVVALDGAEVTEGYFDYFGNPLAVAVVLAHEPQNEQARTIWAQLYEGNHGMKTLQWLPPEVVL